MLLAVPSLTSTIKAFSSAIPRSSHVLIFIHIERPWLQIKLVNKMAKHHINFFFPQTYFHGIRNKIQAEKRKRKEGSEDEQQELPWGRGKSEQEIPTQSTEAKADFPKGSKSQGKLVESGRLEQVCWGEMLPKGVKMEGTESYRQRKQQQLGKSSLCLETTKASAWLRQRQITGPLHFSLVIFLRYLRLTSGN